MDLSSNAGGYSDQDFTYMMKQGSVLFTHGKYARAAFLFRKARDASIQVHDESSLERALVHYDLGLCLLCQVPVPENDPMCLVPKEVDYFLSLVIPSPSSAFKTYRGAMEERYITMLEDAKKELNLAWSLVEYKLDCYIGKANILSALGEVAFRRGEPNPQRYYFEALSLFDLLYGEYNKRVADINVKLCICLEGSDKSKAIAYGKKAWLFYKTRMMQLLSEVQSSSKPAGTWIINQRTVPSQGKSVEIGLLLDISTKLKDKLDRLETGSSTSLIREGTSVSPAGHRHAEGEVRINTNLELCSPPSLNRVGTLVTPAGHRHAEGEVRINTRLEL